MARNLSWIDKRKLKSLLDEDDEEQAEARPEPARGLLDDDDEDDEPPSRFEARRGRFDAPPPANRFGAPAPEPRAPRARFEEPAPRSEGPPPSFLGDLPTPAVDDDPPAPPPFPEPAGGWRPSPDAMAEPPTPPPLGEHTFQEPASEVTEELPADDSGPFELPHDESVLDSSDNPDLEGLATALDALPLEAFATSGPSSFDLPPSSQEPRPAPSKPKPRPRQPAAAIVDEAAQFNPFDQSPPTDAPADPDTGDAPTGSADDASSTERSAELAGDDTDDPERAWAAAFGSDEEASPLPDPDPEPVQPPPPIEEIELPASSFEDLSPVAAAPPVGPPPPVDGAPAPIEDISLPSAELLNPTLDVERPPEGFTPGEQSAPAYTVDLDEATGATEETGSHDDADMDFAPPAYEPPPSSTGAPPAREPPPRIEDEAVELTCERFFDWALDHVGLDGALVVDQDGLLISERGIHELLPSLLAEALPLARGLVRLHDAPPAGHLYLERDRLHVVIVWCLGPRRSFVAGLSGLATPQTLAGLHEAFAALFGDEP